MVLALTRKTTMITPGQFQKLKEKFLQQIFEQGLFYFLEKHNVSILSNAT